MLLGYENMIVKDSLVVDDFDVVHVQLEATFNIFKPAPGVLPGTVALIRQTSAVILVEEYFQVLCLVNQSSSLEVGDNVLVNITSVAYLDGRPQLLGEVLQNQPDTKQHSRGARRRPPVNQAFKRVKNFSDDTQSSSDEDQDLGAPAAKVNKKSSDKETELNTSEADLKLKTKKSKSDSYVDQESTATVLTLPEGFQVLKKRYKSGRVHNYYTGPDGAKYRSLKEIYRKLQSTADQSN